MKKLQQKTSMLQVFFTFLQGSMMNSQLHLATWFFHDRKQIILLLFLKIKMSSNIPKEEINQEAIIINKQREIQNDLMIQQKWKQARSHFYTHIIKQTLDQSSHLSQVRKMRIIAIFVREELQKELQMDFDKLGELKKCYQEISYLKQRYQQIQTSFSKQARECMPLARAIKFKLNNLRIIQIQYRANAHLYSISAFELFKLVNDNKHLLQVTLKGVLVQSFEQLINTFKTIKKNEKQKNEKKQDSWIKYFNPSKQLKLSINAKVQFQIQNKQQTNSKLHNLVLFGAMFNSLSDITVSIILGDRIQINDWKNTLQYLLTVLASPHPQLYTEKQYKQQANLNLKRLKLSIEGNTQYIPIQILRSVLFGGLISFKQIAQLTLKNFSFKHPVIINDTLAMEQSLITIFQNNNITHLRLDQCRNFPIFPKISTLQQLNLRNGSFSKKDSIIKEYIKINPQLRCLSCWGFYGQLIIDESLLTRLQTLVIGQSYLIDLGNLVQSPCNVKNLQINASSIGNYGCLSRLIPKLVNLTCLNLNNISFGDQMLSAIPSPHLEKLIIQFNPQITDRGLQVIDQKWPYLRSFSIKSCTKITADAWTICKFKGLFQLKTNPNMFKKKRNILQNLKERGIKVN